MNESFRALAMFGALASACDSRLHIAVRPLQPEVEARAQDVGVCTPVPSLPEQNKAFTDFVARALAWRLYCEAQPKCEGLQALLPTDLYGKPMSLVCPRGRFCSAGEDVRDGTPDDACRNVILEGKKFTPLAIPARATRFISTELPLCDGVEEPLATVSAFLRERGGAVTIISLDCPVGSRCEFDTLRDDNYGHGAVELVDRQWKVTAHELPPGPRDEVFKRCTAILR